MKANRVACHTVGASTSDSLAAQVALVGRARELILLKSATIPDGVDWQEASENGLVDEIFAKVLREAGRNLEVRAVNLRASVEA